MKKTVLVIGGSGGIGLETARELNKKGMNVCLTYSKNKKKLEEKLREEKIRAAMYKVDINTEGEVARCMECILKEQSRIDCVVYCVSAPVVIKRISELGWNDFQNHLNLQVRGFFEVVKALSAKNQAKEKMKFVAVLTEYCIGRPPSMISPYITAKYALMGLCKAMSVEMARYNYTFNMVSPGMTRTNLISTIPEKMVEMSANNNPLRRIAEPLDVAKVIVFLTSSGSDYINGENIIVNGGNILS